MPSIGESITLPGGAVDMHVHLRQPGATHKEDFATGTLAALAGGVTVVMDMPNNPGANTNSKDRLLEKQRLAEGNVYVDTSFYYGSKPSDNNLSTFPYAAERTFGLKSYLEITTDTTEPSEPQDYKDIWQAWHEVAAPTQPIILHAEQRTIQDALALAAGEVGHPTHVAHVSNRAELEAVMWARRQGWQVTCGVTPHHLFMDSSDVHSWFQRMKPPLARPEDVEFLWRNLDHIDVVETDHAPHTVEEKELANQENPSGDPEGKVTSFGVPGLEAMVPLLFSAYYYSGRAIYNKPRHYAGKSITLEQLRSKLYIRPRQILGLPMLPKASATIRFEEHEFGAENIRTKSGWSPYSGWLMAAKVVQVYAGVVLYQDGNLRSHRPNGRVLTPLDTE